MTITFNDFVNEFDIHGPYTGEMNKESTQVTEKATGFAALPKEEQIKWVQDKKIMFKFQYDALKSKYPGILTSAKKG